MAEFEIEEITEKEQAGYQGNYTSSLSAEDLEE